MIFWDDLSGPLEHRDVGCRCAAAEIKPAEVELSSPVTFLIETSSSSSAVQYIRAQVEPLVWNRNKLELKLPRRVPGK